MASNLETEILNSLTKTKPLDPEDLVNLSTITRHTRRISKLLLNLEKRKLITLVDKQSLCQWKCAYVLT